MLKSVQSDSTYFYNSHRPRLNNPTYVSSNMTDSLTNLNPPHNYTKNLAKQTSYKQSFESHHSENGLYGTGMPSPFAKYSKAAFQKNRSMMSNYGATILRQSNRNTLK